MYFSLIVDHNNRAVHLTKNDCEGF